MAKTKKRCDVCFRDYEEGQKWNGVTTIKLMTPDVSGKNMIPYERTLNLCRWCRNNITEFLGIDVAEYSRKLCKRCIHEDSCPYPKKDHAANYCADYRQELMTLEEVRQDDLLNN